MPDAKWRIKIPGAESEVELKGVSERMAMGFGIAAMGCVTAVVITVLILVFG